MTRAPTGSASPIGSIGPTDPTDRPEIAKAVRPGWDALLLAVLVIARLRIDSLAEQAVLPFRFQDVLRHPVLGRILSPAGRQAMGEVNPSPGEPVALLLIALTLGLLILYLLVDLTHTRIKTRLKWGLLALILVTAVALPTARMMLLRQGSGPASYAHDGGVIQTESVIEFFVEGRNPYQEEYTETPMAEWGFGEFRTALYHYPYLPWTFVFSAPFYLLGSAAGFFDQRMIYLLLWAAALALAPRLVDGPRRKLGLTALLGLNPIMVSDLIYGQNDVFILSWIVLALVAWRQAQTNLADGQPARAQLILAALLFGLACASKPTAWFFAPFFGLLLLKTPDCPLGSGWGALTATLPRMARAAWPALLVFGLLVGPYLIWDAGALYDDVWRWSSGQGETGYQIWGWGASNFVLALGLVADRFGHFPFLALEALFGLPVLAWFLRRQQRENTLANACWHYGLFLLIFFYSSRFLNENYLGYLLAFLALGYLAGEDGPARPEDQST